MALACLAAGALALWTTVIIQLASDIFEFPLLLYSCLVPIRKFRPFLFDVCPIIAPPALCQKRTSSAASNRRFASIASSKYQPLKQRPAFIDCAPASL
jgi:hypothetical protein